MADAETVILGNSGTRGIVAKAFQVLSECLLAANWLQLGFHISMVAQVEKPVNSFSENSACNVEIFLLWLFVKGESKCQKHMKSPPN